MSKINGFDWKSSNHSTIIENNDEYVKERNWQIDCRKQLQNEQLGVINAPTGSGKSIVIASIAWKKAANNNKKVIICVPETLIASSFGKNIKVKLTDGTKIDWNPKTNLCNQKGIKTIEELVSFLSTKGNSDINERIVICCRQTLVMCWEKFRNEKFWNNLILVVDEAHHVQQNSNRIGEVVEKLSHKNDIVLVTATFFRGDKQHILSDELESKFSKYSLPLDVWINQMKHFKNFSYDFVFGSDTDTTTNYLSSVKNCIDSLFSSNHKKIIIYIPHRRNKMKTDCKKNEVRSIVEMLAKKFGAKKIKTNDHGIIELINEKGEKYKVLDLVSEENRHARKDYFSGVVDGVNINKEPNALDCIISLNMFKEGCDWEFANGMIITGVKESVTDLVQMVGRVIRDKQGKPTAKIMHIMPLMLDDEIENKLNTYFKLMAVNMLMENAMNPISEIKDSPLNIDGKERNEKVESALNKLDENKKISLLNNVFRYIFSKYDVKDESVDVIGKIKKCVVEFFGVNKITKSEIEEISCEIFSILSRRALKMKNENVSNIDWDMIEKCKNPSNFIQHYISSLVDKDSLNLLRERMNSGESEENKIAEEICAFYKKNGHILLNDSKFGIWICSLRRKIKEGGSPYESTVEMFEKAGIWEEISCLNSKEIRENKIAEEICAFYKKNGDIPLTDSKFEVWIYSLRRKIREGGSPYESTVEILKKAGIWEEISCLNIHKVRQAETAEEICVFYKKNGHLPLAKSKLGSWIITLRCKIREGDSPYESTVEILKKAGIWEEISCLNIHEVRQNKAAEEICTFYKKNGHLPLADSKLGRWIHTLRKKIRKDGSPYESTVEILKKAGIWEEISCVNIYEVIQNEAAEEICTFYKKNGHLPLANSKLGKSITSWQRKMKKGVSPYESTVEILKKDGIWEEVICLKTTNEIKENKIAEVVCAFYKKNGHIPLTTSKLRRWIVYLRNKMEKGVLPYESTAEILKKAEIWDLVVGKD